jgi:hypothetical protein
MRAQRKPPIHAKKGRRLNRSCVQRAGPTDSSRLAGACGSSAGTDATRGTSRPAAATAHRSASQVSVASVTCTQTMSSGSRSS